MPDYDITSAQMDALQEPTMTEPRTLRQVGGDMKPADLRHLAEAGIAGTVGRVTPETWQAILALLDELDWHRMTKRGAVAVAQRNQDAAERRVTALEEAYKRLASQRHSLSEQPVHMEHVFSECPHPDCLAARKVLAP